MLLSRGTIVSDSCNKRYAGRALEKTKDVEGQILEAPTSLIPSWLNLFCQLSTLKHGHEAKDMLDTSSD